MRQGGSVLTPIFIVIFFMVAVFYGVGVLNTGNVMWMLPMQPDYEPNRIVVRDAGQEEVYLPNSAEYDILTAALNEAFSKFSNTDFVPVGLSEETLREYDETALVIEAFYPQEIRFNIRARMSNVNQLLIPIRGRHDGNRYVFMGSNGEMRIGALVMASDAPLREALAELGYVE